GANALAGDLEDGVTHCRPNGGDTRLANAAPFVAAGERQVCLHLGHLIHTEHLVGVKVALHSTTLFDGDLAIEGVRQAIDNATFHLLCHRQRIDDMAAVHGTDHAFNPYFAALADGHLSHLANNA